jgi:hypothetical protein
MTKDRRFPRPLRTPNFLLQTSSFLLCAPARTRPSTAQRSPHRTNNQ